MRLPVAGFIFGGIMMTHDDLLEKCEQFLNRHTMSTPHRDELLKEIQDYLGTKEMPFCTFPPLEFSNPSRTVQVLTTEPWKPAPYMMR